MFGLFQADLPVGKQLWASLVAFAIVGILAASPLAQISSDPVIFVESLLLLYGFALLASIAVALIVLALAGLIKVAVRKRKAHDDGRREDEEFFKVMTAPTNWLSFRIMAILVPVTFVAAALFGATHLTESPTLWLGKVGLIVYLFILLLDWNALGFGHISYLYITKKADERELTALLIMGRSRDGTLRLDYSVRRSSWLGVLSFLGNNGWELVSLSNPQDENGRFEMLLQKPISAKPN